jgi:2-dehydro-3-deoxygalactonokinase
MNDSMIAVIDGGTTRTRLRLWDGHGIVWESSCAVGARNVAKEGREAVRKPLVEMLAQARVAQRVAHVVAYGMITSDNGLHEVTHVTAPVGFDALGKAVVTHVIDGLGTIHFIPGVKTMVASPTVKDIGALDMMRGEETEAFGLRLELELQGPADFFHVGSHHKLIRTDDRGILASLTTLTGELLAALQHHSILASSTTALEALGVPDFDAWSAGMQTAQRQGFSRAAFCVRLLDQLLGRSPEFASAFLVGAAASLDLPLLLASHKLYLYGHDTITTPLCRYLQNEGKAVEIIQGEHLKQAATRAAANLLQKHLTR